MAGSEAIKLIPGGERDRFIGDIASIKTSHRGKHVSRKMVMHKTAIALVIVGRMRILRFCNHFVRMTIMMHMLNHRSHLLVVPRLMRTPCHTRHDERANEH